MKKVSFTKLIMVMMIACNIAVIVFTCIMVWRTGDLSPMGYLAMGEGVPLGTWLAAYAYKEKAANKSKYAMLYVDKFAAEHGAETAIRMAEIVLQE